MTGMIGETKVHGGEYAQFTIYTSMKISFCNTISYTVDVCKKYLKTKKKKAIYYEHIQIPAEEI